MSQGRGLERVSVSVVLLLFCGTAAAQTQFAERGLRRYLPLLQGAYDFDFADVDMDGDDDLILVGDGAKLFALMNDGNGAFVDQSATRLPSLPGFRRGLALGDVDADGDVDIATGDKLLVNGGHGVFVDRTALQLPAGSPAASDVELGDFDADGDLDMLFTPYLASGARLYFNDGAGAFQDVTAANWSGMSLYGFFELGDVDGDDDLDVLGSQGAGPGLSINDGNGVFTDVSFALPSFGALLTALVLFDVEGDGDLDVWMGDHNLRDVMWLNDGQGTFLDTSGRIPAMSGYAGALGIGDYDGDGDVDVLRSIRFDPTRLLENDGNGFFSDVSSQLPSIVNGDTALGFHDTDGDGDEDIYLATHRLLHNHAGQFTEAPSFAFENLSARTFGAGDLNGDGAMDVVTGGGWGFVQPIPNYVFLSAGPGEPFAKTQPSYDNTYSLAVGDVDGDGDLDLAEGNATAWEYPFPAYHSNLIKLNDGNGNFSTSNGLPTDQDDTRAVVLFDLDGDGDLDLVAGNYGQQDKVYVNQGGGTFVLDASRLPALLSTTTALAVGDVDGDGDDDVVTAAYSAQNRLYLNNGEGLFADGTAGRLPSDNATSEGVALGDIDGDGDLDALFANRSTTAAFLYLNDGTGTFVDVSARLTNSTYARACALADIDDDGDLDVVLGRAATPAVKVYENEGGGGFIDRAGRFPAISGEPLGLLLADLDHDRDPEVFLGYDPETYSGGDYLVNLHRQLEARLLPRIGRTYEFELHAEPGYATGQRYAAIAISAARLDPPIPAPRPLQGTLFLQAPYSTLPLAAIPMLEGYLRISFTMPNDTSLVGLPFFVQAAILGGDRPELTGYLAEVFGQ